MSYGNSTNKIFGGPKPGSAWYGGSRPRQDQHSFVDVYFLATLVSHGDSGVNISPIDKTLSSQADKARFQAVVEEYERYEKGHLEAFQLP